jgi:hypothetical protein
MQRFTFLHNKKASQQRGLPPPPTSIMKSLVVVKNLLIFHPRFRGLLFAVELSSFARRKKTVVNHEINANSLDGFFGVSKVPPCWLREPDRQRELTSIASESLDD